MPQGHELLPVEVYAHTVVQGFWWENGNEVGPAFHRCSWHVGTAAPYGDVDARRVHNRVGLVMVLDLDVRQVPLGHSFPDQ